MHFLRNSLVGRVRHHHVLVVVFALAILGGVQWWRISHSTNGVRAAFEDVPVAEAGFFPGVEGTVYALAKDGDTLYVGGSFNKAGKVAKKIATISKSTGELEISFIDSSVVDGALYTAISDGTGGWYVAGNFNNQIGPYDFEGVAHVLSDGSVDSQFEVVTNGPVYALVLDGSTLYIGGNFTTIDGSTTRNNIAALDVTTGEVTSFDPDVSDIVYTLAIEGTTLYAGGMFTSVNGGTPRNHLAAIDTGTGLATAFDPSVSDNVRALLIAPGENILYAGGDFSLVGVSGRNHLAAIDTVTGTATSFDPDVDDWVYSLALDGTTLYAGGIFTMVNGGTTRNHLAAFDTSTGLATTFDPDLDNRPHALILDGSTIYAGGIFTTVNGGTARKSVAAFDADTGVVTSFDPAFGSSTVNAIVDGGDALLFVGVFSLVNTVARNNLAAFNVATGSITSFDPDIDSSVESLVLDGTTLYAGGSFTSVNGGTTRNHAAAFDTSTGTVTAFDPDIDSNVSSMFLSGATLYAGGEFTSVNGGTIRNHAAAFDTATGIATSFDPDVDSQVKDMVMATDESVVFLAGDFTSVNGGTTRNYLAAFDSVTGLATSFDPDVDSGVHALEVDDTTLYAAGDFTAVNGGMPRNYLAAFDPGTGIATDFDPNVDSSVNAPSILLEDDALYVGGDFTSVNDGDYNRNYFASFDAVTGIATSFDPSPNDGPRVLLSDGDNLYVGGGFDGTGGMSGNQIGLSSLAIFPVSAIAATPTPQEETDQNGSFLSPEQLERLLATPTPAFTPDPVYTPDPAGGISLQDAAVITTSRLVKISYDNPFDDSTGVTIRTVNADALTAADRELLYQQRYGKELETPAPDQQLRDDGTLQLLDTTGNVELQSGTMRTFAPTVTGWDLCAGAASCPSGTYTVFAQFIKPTAGVATVLGVIGDQVSDIYSDSIEYVVSTPVATPASSPVNTPTTPAPLPSSSPGVTPQPSQTAEAVPGPETSFESVLSQVGESVDGIVPGRPVASSALLATLMLLPFALTLFSSHRYVGQTTYASLFVLQSILEAFGLRKKRRNWGTIYDALTKRPIPFGKVELRDSASRVLETRHADAQGRYGFLITPQSLQSMSLDVLIQPTVPGYNFPSAAVTSDPDFFVYDHIYKGGSVTLREDALVNFNIPLDRAGGPESMSLYATHVRLRGATNGILNIAFWVGLLLVPLNAILYPSVWTIGLLIVFVAANVVRVVSELFRPYGLVKDAEGTPMPFTLIILQELNGMRISFTVTDERGRYFLLVPSGRHQLVMHSAAHITPQRSATMELASRKGWLSKRFTL